MKLTVTKCTQTKKGHQHITLQTEGAKKEIFPGVFQTSGKRNFYMTNVDTEIPVGTELELDTADWTVVPRESVIEDVDTITGEIIKTPVTLNYLFQVGTKVEFAE